MIRPDPLDCTALAKTVTFPLCALLAITLGGCTPREAGPPTPDSRSGESTPPRSGQIAVSRPEMSPLNLRFTGGENPVAGEPLTLTLMIHYAVARPEPISLSFKIPAGARVLSGGQTESLFQAPDDGLLTRKITIQFETTIPVDDVVAIAEQRGEGFGVRASVAYRFGREEPRLPVPAVGPAQRTTDGRPIGRAIPLGQ